MGTIQHNTAQHKHALLINKRKICCLPFVKFNNKASKYKVSKHNHSFVHYGARLLQTNSVAKSVH